MKQVIAILYLALCLCPAMSRAATTDELEARLQALQEELSTITQYETSNQQNHGMTVAGYTDAAYISDSRNSVSPTIHLQHLSLFFKQEISQQWRFFSEIEFEHTPQFETGNPITVQDCGPDKICGTLDDTNTTINTLEISTGTIFTEALNLDFNWRSYASFRIGRFFTPAGIWSIDHYPPFVATQERPRHIREIFPQTTDGILVFGIAPVFKHFVSYDLYAGNGEGNISQDDENNHKALGLKLNFDLPYLNNFMVGTTLYHDVLNDDTDKKAFGVHAKIRQGDVELQSEYANALLKPAIGNSYRKQGYYLQGLYQLNNWTLGLRYDFYDSQTSLKVNETTRSVFVNYHITENLNMKLETHAVNLQDPALEDYYKTIISINASLGH